MISHIIKNFIVSRWEDGSEPVTDTYSDWSWGNENFNLVQGDLLGISVKGRSFFFGSKGVPGEKKIFLSEFKRGVNLFVDPNSRCGGHFCGPNSFGWQVSSNDINYLRRCVPVLYGTLWGFCSRCRIRKLKELRYRTFLNKIEVCCWGCLKGPITEWGSLKGSISESYGTFTSKFSRIW